MLNVSDLQTKNFCSLGKTIFNWRCSFFSLFDSVPNTRSPRHVYQIVALPVFTDFVSGILEIGMRCSSFSRESWPKVFEMSSALSTIPSLRLDAITITTSLISSVLTSSFSMAKSIVSATTSTWGFHAESCCQMILIGVLHC